MSTVAIKVAFKGVNRQIRIATDTSFSQLAHHIAQLFQVQGDVTLLYLDEDQDLVSVNSDMELQEAFSYVGKDGKLRVELQVHPDAPTPALSRVPSTVPSIAPVAPVEPYKVTAVNPVQEYSGQDEDEPIHDVKQEEEEEEPSKQEEDGPITKEQLTQQFLALLQQHQDLLASHPMLSAHANALADQVITEIQGQDANEPAAEEHVDAVKALESVLQVMTEFQPQVFFVRRGGCPNRMMRPCMRAQRFHPWGHGGHGGYRCGGPRRPTQEEQLAALADMGFTDDQANKDLLHRYQGNMERVVELLTRQQEGETKDEGYMY